MPQKILICIEKQLMLKCYQRDWTTVIGESKADSREKPLVQARFWSDEDWVEQSAIQLRSFACRFKARSSKKKISFQV